MEYSIPRPQGSETARVSAAQTRPGPDAATRAQSRLVGGKGQDLALTGGVPRLQTFSAVEGRPAVLLVVVGRLCGCGPDLIGSFGF
jgi:hypothetical protein